MGLHGDGAQSKLIPAYSRETRPRYYMPILDRPSGTHWQKSIGFSFLLMASISIARAWKMCSQDRRTSLPVAIEGMHSTPFIKTDIESVQRFFNLFLLSFLPLRLQYSRCRCC